jgi:hypothetical protein
MKRILPIILVGMFGAWTAAAQSSAPVEAGASTQSQTSVHASRPGARASSNESASTSAAGIAGAGAAKGSTNISSGTKVNARLENSLDAKKSKPGDRVEARTTRDVKENGKVVLKKGTRLTGHVTRAQAHANGQSDSQLGIVFDHAVLKNGQEVPFHATIQALAASQASAMAATGPDDMMASGGGMGAVSGTAQGGGGLVGGVASTAGGMAGSVVNTAGSVPLNAGGTLNSATSSTGAVGGLTSTGSLTSNSIGIIGLNGLSIDSAASSTTQGSMIVSSTKNVHLDSGTQLLLNAYGQAQ